MFNVLLSVFVEKISVSIWAAKRTSYWQSYRDRGYLISSLYHLSRLLSQAFELVCLYKGGNKPDVRNLNFALQSSVQSGSKLLPVIMCTMLLDSLDNSRLKT